MHKMYLEKIDILDHKEKIKEIIEMLLCDVKGSNYGLYEHINSELYEMAYGMKINEEMAIKWVEDMKPLGEYWSMETISSLNNPHRLEDFYVVMNSLVNDYGNIINKEEVETYIKMADAWLDDIDAKEYKVWKYFVE